MSDAKEFMEALDAEEEERFVQAETYIRESGRASVSALQRKFLIGYGRACRLMEQLEIRKVVSPIDHEGRRTVLTKQVTP